MKHLIIYLLFPIYLFSYSIQEKFQHASPGDYIVLEQNKTCSLVIIHSKNNNHMIFEEISFPYSKLSKTGKEWSSWMKNGAKHATSWDLFEIDLATNELVECYSFTKNSFLQIDQNLSFITKLLSLQLEPVKNSDRKKIGPPPSHGQSDFRKLWNPPLYQNNKKVSNASFEVYSASWPKDESVLSQKKIEVYFDKNNPTFPFPHWIHIKDSSYTFKIRSIDSGKNLTSNHIDIPRKSLVILKPITIKEGKVLLTVNRPKYYKDIHVFASDVITNRCIPIPFKELNEKNGQVTFECTINGLEKNHSYHFCVAANFPVYSTAITSDIFENL